MYTRTDGGDDLAYAQYIGGEWRTAVGGRGDGDRGDRAWPTFAIRVDWPRQGLANFLGRARTPSRDVTRVRIFTHTHTIRTAQRYVRVCVSCTISPVAVYAQITNDQIRTGHAGALYGAVVSRSGRPASPSPRPDRFFVGEGVANLVAGRERHYKE